MELFAFQHGPPVKAGCCNWETSATYWMADSREAAEQEIREIRNGGEEPHGLCPNCLVRVLTSGNYEILEVDETAENGSPNVATAVAYDVLERARNDEVLTGDEQRTLNEAHSVLQEWEKVRHSEGATDEVEA